MLGYKVKWATILACLCLPKRNLHQELDGPGGAFPTGLMTMDTPIRARGSPLWLDMRAHHKRATLRPPISTTFSRPHYCLAMESSSAIEKCLVKKHCLKTLVSWPRSSCLNLVSRLQQCYTTITFHGQMESCSTSNVWSHLPSQSVPGHGFLGHMEFYLSSSATKRCPTAESFLATHCMSHAS